MTRNVIKYMYILFCSTVCYNNPFNLPNKGWSKASFFCVLHYKQTPGSSMARHTITCLLPSLTLDLSGLPSQKQDSSTRVGSVLMCQGNAKAY